MAATDACHRVFWGRSPHHHTHNEHISRTSPPLPFPKNRLRSPTAQSPAPQGRGGLWGLSPYPPRHLSTLWHCRCTLHTPHSPHLALTPRIPPPQFFPLTPTAAAAAAHCYVPPSPQTLQRDRNVMRHRERMCVCVGAGPAGLCPRCRCRPCAAAAAPMPRSARKAVSGTLPHAPGARRGGSQCAGLPGGVAAAASSDPAPSPPGCQQLSPPAAGQAAERFPSIGPASRRRRRAGSGAREPERRSGPCAGESASGTQQG